MKVQTVSQFADNETLKIYCAKKDIRNDVLHQLDLVANAIPGVDELTSITQSADKGLNC